VLFRRGRRKSVAEAGGRREESLYNKCFRLFQLDSYFCRAALVQHSENNPPDRNAQKACQSILITYYLLLPHSSTSRGDTPCLLAYGTAAPREPEFGIRKGQE
jgi:hypothetical protein